MKLIGKNKQYEFLSSHNQHVDWAFIHGIDPSDVM